METFHFPWKKTNIKLWWCDLCAGLCQTSVCPFIWGILSVGWAKDPQCFIHNGMMCHIFTFLSRKLQLLFTLWFHWSFSLFSYTKRRLCESLIVLQVCPLVLASCPSSSWEPNILIRARFQFDWLQRKFNLTVIPLQLTAEKKVDRGLLPPKKMLGKNSKSLVERRQKELELYLQTLLLQFPQATPTPLAYFLHFHLYVSILLQTMVMMSSWTQDFLPVSHMWNNEVPDKDPSGRSKAVGWG